MSVYLINKILYLTDNDADFRKRMREDPEGTVKSFPLNGAEMEALITGDVGTLYEMGVYTFFLNHIARTARHTPYRSGSAPSSCPD